MKTFITVLLIAACSTSAASAFSFKDFRHGTRWMCIFVAGSSKAAHTCKKH